MGACNESVNFYRDEALLGVREQLWGSADHGEWTQNLVVQNGVLPWSLTGSTP